MFLLRTLGGLELLRTGDGGDHAIAMQAKRLALLAHLAALPPNTFRRRDTVLLLFWPELDQEHARGALRQALHFLRKTLGEGAILTRGEDEIALEPSGFRSDARSLEAALAAGDPQQALTLYRGDFLEGVFVSDAAPELEDWISSERLRLRGLAARAAWMAAELPANRDSAGELVRRAVQWSGDDEAALRRGLRLLDGMGDRAGAAALYDEFARRVARDLDIQLSKETRDVIRALRARRDSGGVDRGATVPSSIPTDVARPQVESASRIAPVARPGRRLLLAGLAGALLVLALAAKMAPRRNEPHKPSSDVIAVMPFQVTGVDTSINWLQKGIVELLTIRLSGTGSPRLADPATVIANWQRQAPNQAWVSHDDALQVASRSGASRLIEGSITGTQEHLVLSASLSSVTGTGTPARAVVEGPADSLTQLIDRLAAQLLGMAAGMEGARLASLTSTSLPAIRLFLAGQSALRTGRRETAVLRFDEALSVDSNFALAGLQLCRAAIWAGTEEQQEHGCRRALANRRRLSAADNSLLSSATATWFSSSEEFAAAHAAVSAYPDRPEVWYKLGDLHFHWGAQTGEERWMERATEAFQRGWMLDSAAGAGTVEPPVAEPIEHLVQMAHIRHDTAEVLRLVATVLTVDSTSELARAMMWHRAQVTSAAAREEFWSSISSATQPTTKEIILFIVWTGIGAEDLDRAHQVDEARLRVHDPGYANFAFTAQALNEGRPQDIPPAPPTGGLAANRPHRARIRLAMAWDGDTSAALESAAILARSEARTVAGEAALQQLFDICTLGEWQGSRGDYKGAGSAAARLREALAHPPVSSDSLQTRRYLMLCTALLDAMYASGTRAHDARDRLVAADSAAKEFAEAICCTTEKISDTNIEIARLWEREGDLPAAMRALSRRSGLYMVAPMYMSTFVREEGRLADRMGDTATALSAYRHYLALRQHPQPSLQPGVDSIRARVAVLESR